MHISLPILLLLLQGIYADECIANRSVKNVVVLNDENFHSVIASNDFVMIFVYTNWCGELCDNIITEWESAATTLKDGPTVFSMVDTAHESCQAVNDHVKLTMIPAILYFKYQNHIPFRRPRVSDSFVAWAIEHSRTPDEITTIDEIQEAQQKYEVFVIAYFDTTDPKVHKAYFSAATVKDHLKFFFTLSEDVAAHLGVLRSTVVISKAFDEGRADLDIAGTMVTSSLHDPPATLY